ncbi:MAG: TatD family hydrolase [Gemmataceae bacterium]
MAELCDTHAHLDAEQFDPDRPAVLDRARAAGVTRVIAVGITASSSERCLELSRRHPGVEATVGIHPNEITQAAPGDWDRVREMAARPGVVGVGETGLDRYWDKTPFALQEEWLVRHLELGRELGLAVVIHCREAEADVVRLLREAFDRHGPVRAVMHSFSGSRETAEACLAMGLYLSFAGMLTYKNAQPLRDVAVGVPPGRLLVETDCPYLAPVPLRGKRNEPANVVHTAACLASVLATPPDDLYPRLVANALELFSPRRTAG